MFDQVTEETEQIQAKTDQETVVLIAEDDNGYFQLMNILFKREQIKNEIIRFTNGQDVIDFLQNDPAADYVLILDIRMPKMDGIEVLKHIKQSDQLKDIPVVIHSSNDNPATIELCYSLGCLDYIVKSGNPSAILQLCKYIS